MRATTSFGTKVSIVHYQQLILLQALTQPARLNHQIASHNLAVPQSCSYPARTRDVEVTLGPNHSTLFQQ